jgi:hypothetical protein
MEKPQKFNMHILNAVKNKYVPGRWIFFDSETHTEVINGFDSERFTLGWTCYWDRWSRYWPGYFEWKFWENEEDVCRYIHDMCSKGKQIHLVGHNIFFDLQACGFFMYFTHWKWKLDFIYDKGMTYILRCRRQGKVLTILSTTNWFDASLEKLGEKIGLPKGKIDFDKATRHELKQYCRRDVEILVHAVMYYINFLRKNDLGKLSITKASQAFSSYRYRFMQHKIMIHKEPGVTNLERKAYTGGRVECFRLGEQKGGPFLALDVNSMYPYVMQKYEYPWELVSYNTRFDINRYKDITKSHCVVAEVDIDTPEPAFAIKEKGKTIFPVGNFQCCLCTEGFKYALERGYIKKITRSAVYRKADLFTAYVEFFHKLRHNYKSEENDIMELLCKYMENALYGKFGQKSVIREEYDEFTGREYWKEEVVNIDTGELTIMTKLMNKLIVAYSECEGDNAFPALAAHITENARMELWDLINHIGTDKVLYCDTDSVWIPQSNLEDVNWPINDHVLGALKIQHRTGRLYLGGAKNYRTDRERHIKGIPEEAKEIEPNVFRYPVFRRQDTHLRQGQIVGCQVDTMERTVSFTYDKGVVHPDGRVTPFRF